MLTIAGTLIIGVSAFFLGRYLLFGNLPDDEAIRSYRPANTKNVDFDTHSLAFPEKPVRIWVHINRISPDLQKAVLISEDDTFYQHEGINWVEFKIALKKNIESKRYKRGASTITMQLARNAFLTKEKTLLRKFREVIVARRMEEILSKRRIFELYLNIVEWGPNIYGAEAAARFYFNKSASDLNMAEASMLAAMLPNPRRFNPVTRMKSAKKLQLRVLALLRDARVITPEEYQMLTEQPLLLRNTRPEIPEDADEKIDSSISQASNDSLLLIPDSTLDAM
ncbi:monofunctional biosynthetic peptidoglycan transglycosylase [candidate division KSB1 bacterium]|nr:monofunctional biosynthetic peptidoglycan transglycosylase [candidate division KSB1 bacterium]